ncbi:MAG: hypothetical protein HZA04_10615 [Nitrospinae bacterium]|nr:hypothetical protein [Nitrospinota bacterium]
MHKDEYKGEEVVQRIIGLLGICVCLLFSPAFAVDFGSLISPGDLSSYHKELDGMANCTKCHAVGGGIQNETCNSCHKDIGAAQLVKKGLHGAVASQRCVECHSDHKGRSYSMVEWDPKTFDHGKTGYKLAGKHAKTDCAKCHKTKTKLGFYSYSGLATACKSCHEDIHKGTLKDACETCHNTNTWRGKDVTFDHNKVYKLDGKHTDVKCQKCHPAKGMFQVAEKEKCITCHKKDDKHKGQLGAACEKCHQAAGWKDILFDHSTTKYGLQGKHTKVACEKCHHEKGKGVFKVAKYDTCDAPGCHDKGKFGNVHETQFLGVACAKCHTVEGFKPSLFKHESPDYLGFKLKGKHAQVECGKCHRPLAVTKMALFKPMASSTCDVAGCHDIKARGNIHGVQFKGQKCESCHIEEGWKPTLFKHGAEAYKGYKLEGKHAQVECQKCHRADPATQVVLFKPIDAASCSGAFCHDVKERGNIHGAQFKDRKCNDCHTVQGWKPSAFDHNADSYKGYKLEGKHAQAKCQKCHLPAGDGTVAYRPIDTKSCASALCHKDPHARQFADKECDQCHTPKAWKELTFNHVTQARFPLEGKHVSTQCEKCHIGKVWKPLKEDCLACHAKDDDKAHKGKMGAKCEQCHTAQTWEPKSFFHEVTGFALEGAHTQITCNKCHKTKGVFTGQGPECVKCHTDAHQNQFGPATCADCHTAKNWFPERFRHSQTGFRLEGGHRAAKCESCHVGRAYRSVTQDCYTCHAAQYAAPAAAIYHTSGNKSCLDCHKVYSWTPAVFTHATMTFSGAHAAIKTTCAKCHNSTTPLTLKWPGATAESQCATCHYPATYNTKHTNCPTDCALCHNTSAWSPIATGVDSTVAGSCN